MKVWFITDCSSGFGLGITKYALENGDKVVTTLRKPEVPQVAARYPEHFLVLMLDVTQPEEVTAAFAASWERFGRINVVVNNAGSAVCILEVEGTD